MHPKLNMYELFAGGSCLINDQDSLQGVAAQSMTMEVNLPNHPHLPSVIGITTSLLFGSSTPKEAHHPPTNPISPPL